MKKLLLILICLFVSFEVNSESHDLNGKKLSCDDSISINELFSMIGFDFSSKEMIFINSELQRVYLIYSKEIIKLILKK